jgi:hypothetical protein
MLRSEWVGARSEVGAGRRSFFFLKKTWTIRIFNIVLIGIGFLGAFGDSKTIFFLLLSACPE